jgi:sporulation integral membrane protein YlbJ
LRATGSAKKAAAAIRRAALPSAVAAVNLAIILFPIETIDAAKDGLLLWFDNVLPVMLPFMIGCSLLASLGFVEFAGAALERLMRPIFGVPGCAAFALVSGILSGYPMGAAVAADLRARGYITKSEGDRLLMFSNNAGPLFVVGAAGAGMFGSGAFGYYLLAAQALSALTVGIVSGWLAGGAAGPAPREPEAIKKIRDSRPFGGKLGSASLSSVTAVTQIGAFITLFSVVARILKTLGVISFGSPIARGLAIGALEITNGLKETASGGMSFWAAVAAAALIGWGGLSVHAQTAAVVAKTDLSAGAYVVGKAACAAAAAVFAAAMYPFCSGAFAGSAAPAFARSAVSRWGYGAALFGSTMAAALIIAVWQAVSARIGGAVFQSRRKMKR